ncbi:MAG: 4-phosphoerythronate dehydrogenase PdxB [Pseudomonadota bacterium]|nr:4-phosphoerythronate dehydrogenase PdxB [Pseudomonadota bacterium]
MNGAELTIVADENIPALDALFGGLGRIVRRPGRALCRDDLVAADLLLVRSVTRVDAALLAGTPVRFVGTATIGTDHVDQAWLAGQGIGFSSAPGSNADSVVEYVLSALLHLAHERGFDLFGQVVGIVGVGNVGRRLQRRLDGMGIEVLLCDPPRAEREGEAGFVDLATLLRQADIVSLHTPLVRSAPWPTLHLLHADTLALLKRDAILLNTGRGPVIDNRALLAFMRQRSELTLVLDVWEHEPEIDPCLAALCAIATPHIAGYALDGKLRGSWMLYRALCQFLGREATLELEQILPPAQVEALLLSPAADLLTPVRLVYDPFRDDRALRATLSLPPGRRGEAFDRLRRHYPERREFATLPVSAPGALGRRLAALGFATEGRAKQLQPTTDEP